MNRVCDGRASAKPAGDFLEGLLNNARTEKGLGAGNRVRTDDLLITNQLLYQLSYAGICPWEITFNVAIRGPLSPRSFYTPSRVDVQKREPRLCVSKAVVDVADSR